MGRMNLAFKNTQAHAQKPCATGPQSGCPQEACSVSLGLLKVASSLGIRGTLGGSGSFQRPRLEGAVK